jgi:hypothetical protein
MPQTGGSSDDRERMRLKPPVGRSPTAHSDNGVCYWVLPDFSKYGREKGVSKRIKIYDLSSLFVDL